MRKCKYRPLVIFYRFGQVCFFVQPVSSKDAGRREGKKSRSLLEGGVVVKTLRTTGRVGRPPYINQQPHGRERGFVLVVVYACVCSFFRLWYQSFHYFNIQSTYLFTTDYLYLTSCNMTSWSQPTILHIFHNHIDGITFQWFSIVNNMAR